MSMWSQEAGKPVGCSGCRVLSCQGAVVGAGQAEPSVCWSWHQSTALGWRCGNVQVDFFLRQVGQCSFCALSCLRDGVSRGKA